MRQFSARIRFSRFILACAVLACCAVAPLTASPRFQQEEQETSDASAKAKKTPKKSASEKDASQEESENAKPVSAPKSSVTRIPGYPPVEQRVSEYLEQANAGKCPIEESRPYVIEGVTVSGIFTTEAGYGAFLKTEDGRTVMVRKGMKMYNGQIVAIDRDKVVFRQGTGKKTIEKRYGQAINARRSEDGTAQ